MESEHKRELKAVLVATILAVLGAVLYQATNNIIGLVLIGISLVLFAIIGFFGSSGF